MAGNGNQKERLIELDKVWTIIVKNWITLKGDRVRLIPLFTFPLLMLLVFGYTTGNTPKFIPAAIADYDSTQTSRHIIDEIYANQLYSITHRVSSMDEGRKLIDRGVVKALFVIPAGFESDIFAGRPTQLTVIVDESDPSIAQIVKSSTQAFVQVLSAEITNTNLERARLALDAQSQNLDELSRSMSVSRQAAAPQLAVLSSYYYGIQKSVNSSSFPLKVAGQYTRNTLTYLLNPGDIDYVQGELPAYAAQVARQATQQRTLDAANASLATIAANKKLLASATQMNAAGQQLGQQVSVLDLELASYSAALRQSSNELSAVSLKIQKSEAPPISMNNVEPYGTGRPGIDFLLPSILALIIFQGAVAGLGRAIAGERQSGALTRVFLTPTSNLTIILGTQLFYLLFEIIRSSVIVFVAIALFGVSISGSVLDIIAVIALFAFGATGVGMVLSVMSRTQDQYMALSMLISFPIIFLAGVFIPVQTMPAIFQSIAKVIPLTYAADALRGIMVKGFPLMLLIPDLVYLGAFALFIFVLTLLLFKRELV